MTDRTLLYAAAFLRAVGTAILGVLVFIYLEELAIPLTIAGVIVAAGLAGAACAVLFVTVAGDRVSSRTLLIALALLGAAGGGAFALGASPYALGAAAFLGMLNGMGRDRGAQLALEQAVLPAATSDADRTRTFAWYNVLGDAGHALGSVLAGLPDLLRRLFGVGMVGGMRAALGLAALTAVANAALYLRLSPAIAAPPRTARAGLSPETKRVVFKISSLFALDAFGGGLVSTAVVSYFLYERFHVEGWVVGLLIAGARVMNAISHLGAAWLARRIGLVNTMVFTHLPSSLLMMTVTFAPTFPIAAILFLLREGLVEMDVPTRQSYVVAVVKPEERIAASGVTHLVRLGAWAAAKAATGFVMTGLSLGTPVLIGSSMKVGYDVLLWKAFRKVRPPEEAAAARA